MVEKWNGIILVAVLLTFTSCAKYVPGTREAPPSTKGIIPSNVRHPEKYLAISDLASILGEISPALKLLIRGVAFGIYYHPLLAAIPYLDLN